MRLKIANNLTTLVSPSPMVVTNKVVVLVCVNSAKDATLSLLSICWSVGWLACQKDYTSPTERISIKLGWRNGLCQE